MKKIEREGRLMGVFEAMLTDLAASGTCNFARTRLAERLRKKALVERPELKTATIDSFIATNEAMGAIQLAVPCEILGEARLFIAKALESYNSSLEPDGIQQPLILSHLYDLWRFGPGASIKTTGFSTPEKLNQSMSYTRNAEQFVDKLRSSHPYLSRIDAMNKGGMAAVDCSKLTTVPKNETSLRTIAIEPSGNMCLQLAAGTYLDRVLKRVGLDIHAQQEKNVALAKLGSFDGSLSTIDLKAASDRISLPLVKSLFPKDWFDLFMALRSPAIHVPGHGVKRVRMMSTMGNGFTFPLMTLIFTSLLYAYHRFNSNIPRFISWDQNAVYGDDIILPTVDYDGFCILLGQAGFIVNYDKSFSTGSFRESCGGDFYCGQDVTPFYIKSLSSNSEVYVALNSVLSWGARHGHLYNTITYLKSLINGPVFYVPEWLNADQGVQSRECPPRFKYLQSQQRKVRYELNPLLILPLLIGGYLQSSFGMGMSKAKEDRSLLTYTTRSFRPVYKVRRARLPKGYLDGWDPLSRSLPDSISVQFALNLS